MAVRFYRIFVGFLPIVLWCIRCSNCSSLLSTYGYVNQTVEAVVGDVAELLCDTSPRTGDSISVVVWFQDNKSSPICSLDNRHGSHLVNRHAEWSSSVSFNFNETGLSVLKLNPVKRSHQGLYRCRVDFKRSQTREYIVNVKLIVPPEKLIISDSKNGESRNNYLGPYRENETVTIICSAVGGSPPPRVTWWQDSSLLTERFERLPNGTVRNSMSLRLNRGHLNARYTCQASNNPLNSLSTTVTLNMTISPQSVKLVDVEKTMSAGRSYEISCYVYGAHPSPVIKWSKGNEKLKKNYTKSDKNDGNLTISTLSFTPQQEDDGKLLSCAVVDTIFPSSGSFSDSHRLNISYKPIVTIKLGKNLNASAIEEGGGVYFECQIESKSQVVRTDWKRNGELLRQNVSAGILTQENLVLQKVSRRQSGKYTCVVTNAEGSSESNGVYLDVKFAPVCRNSSVLEYGVDRGEKVRVPCEVEANPETSVFVWEFSSAKTGSASKPSEFTTEKRSFIEFQPNSENDYGMLYCRARNSVGGQQQPCTFRIRPMGRPDAVSNCSITNRTSSSLVISCEAGFDGGSEQRFVLEIRKPHNQFVQTLISDSPEFNVSTLQVNVPYDFVIYSSNVKGRSLQSVQFNETLVDETSNLISPASELSPMWRLPPLLLILALLVILLILLSCCIVIVVGSREARRRNKKGYVYKSKESLEKNPDIIPDKDDVSCTFEISTIIGEEKQRPSKQTDISLILENSYGTDMNSDFVLHQDEYKKRKVFHSNKKTSSLRKLNDYEITYAACDQPCPPFVTQDTPLLSSTRRVPLIMEGHHTVHQCSIHGLSRSTSIS